jgi:hypothetical protein
VSTQPLRSFIESMAQPLSWDSLFNWPPDVFAVTAAVLKRTGAYRYAICPPEPEGWPPDYQLGLDPLHLENDAWRDATDFQAQQWIAGDGGTLPALVQKWKSVIEAAGETITLEDLAEISGDDAGLAWSVCEALIGLHCIADSTCRGFGTPMSPERDGLRQFLADHILSVYGSLSRLPKSKGVVLPKMRTPQTGITLRAFSLYATWHETEVSIEWRSLPLVNPDENTVNVLILPWPEEIHPKDFRTSIHPKGHREAGQFRYFEYMPEESHDKVDAVEKAIRAAAPACNRVHALVLPELALTFGELANLKERLTSAFELSQMPRVIISGLRTRINTGREGETSCNDVVLSVFFAGRWYDLRQSKHHRWKLDMRQVGQYSIGGVLASHKGWWEHIDVGRRSLSVLAPTAWLAVSPLICEDLAQLEPVSEIIRGIGPNLLVALLLDGPQLPHRWAARYASVFADDPGTSVLTVTALGMSKRSRKHGASGPDAQGDRTIASWRDAVNGFRSITLDNDERGVLLTLTAQWVEEWTADGRSDGGAAARFILSGVYPIAFTSDASSRLEKPGALTASSVRVAQRVFKGIQTARRHMAAPSDTLEATTFAQAVDASLDGMTSDIQRICLVARILSADGVIAAIGGALPLPNDENAPGAEFERALTYYEDLMRGLLLPASRNKFGRWEAVIASVERELVRVREVDLGAAPLEEFQDWIQNQRTDIAVLATLLWAVHNRLESRRFDGTLTPDGARLLERVQNLLDEV